MNSLIERAVRDVAQTEVVIRVCGRGSGRPAGVPAVLLEGCVSCRVLTALYIANVPTRGRPHAWAAEAMVVSSSGVHDSSAIQHRLMVYSANYVEPTPPPPDAGDAGDNEERPAGDPRQVRRVRHRDVQDWQGFVVMTPRGGRIWSE